MTSSPNPQQARNLDELRNHLKWLDEERRKAGRKVADLEQRLGQHERELVERDQKIEELEWKIAAQMAHFERLPELESKVWQVEKRLYALESRLAQVIDQVVRWSIPDEGRTRLSSGLENTEEATLANRVGELENRIAQISELTATMADEATRTEASVKAWASDQLELRVMVAGTVGSINRDQSELNEKLVIWQATLDEHKEIVDQLSQQWLSLSNQYKEARMAVQNFANWQKQLEQQKRESSEFFRQETNRLQSRWDALVLELHEQLREFEIDRTQTWQAFELDNDQRWAAYRRNEQTWREQLSILGNLIQRVQSDNRNMILRMQAAQINAIKRWPLLLSEEVEKAIEQSPNRPPITATADPHSSLSVIDAIERGLITIDYESESDAGS